jgi:hypothetical protein
MKKGTIAIIVIIVLGFAIFLIGILINELIWNIIGGLVVILPPIVLKIKRKRDRKSLIHYIENENRPILSTKKTHKEFEEKEFWKKARQFIEKIIIMSLVAAAAAGLVIIMMQRFVLKPTYLSVETAISEGCAMLNRGGCKMDPSEITVNYDVNGDEITGGVNDTLSGLLELYNCTGDCIKMRCSCMS